MTLPCSYEMQIHDLEGPRLEEGVGKADETSP